MQGDGREPGTYHEVVSVNAQWINVQGERGPGWIVIETTIDEDGRVVGEDESECALFSTQAEAETEMRRRQREEAEEVIEANLYIVAYDPTQYRFRGEYITEAGQYLVHYTSPCEDLAEEFDAKIQDDICFEPDINDASKQLHLHAKTAIACIYQVAATRGLIVHDLKITAQCSPPEVDMDDDDEEKEEGENERS